MRKPRRVDIVVYPGSKALEAIGTRVFECANTVLFRKGGTRSYEINISSTALGPVPSDLQLTLVATKTPDTLDLRDIAVIAGTREIEGASQANSLFVDLLTC